VFRPLDQLDAIGIQVLYFVELRRRSTDAREI
jgi:hypothetical protein